MNWVFMQASFISLNLHAIAEKLAKVDLSKRLFIEPDLIPSELVCPSSELILKIMWLSLCKFLYILVKYYFIIFILTFLIFS
jgi:hypothetical protein